MERKLSADDFVVLLGRYNIKYKVERGEITREVKKIHVHPDWDISAFDWDADLAVVTLAKSVEFSNYIQPVCFPADTRVEHFNDGTIVRR